MLLHVYNAIQLDLQYMSLRNLQPSLKWRCFINNILSSVSLVRTSLNLQHFFGDKNEQRSASDDLMVFPDNKEDEEHELTYAELDFDSVKIPESSRRLEEELASKGAVKMKKSKKRTSRRRAEDEEVIYSEIAPSQDWPEKKSNSCADTDNDYEEIRCPVR